MAKTYVKRALKAISPNDAFLGLVAEELPEGASQTFPDGSPVVITSGYVVVAASTVTSVFGIASGAGHNTTAGASTAKVFPIYGTTLIEANFLASGAADQAIAQTDLGTKYDWVYGATCLAGSLPGWYIAKTTGGVTVRICSFKSTDIVPNQSEVEALAGDTNARVRATILAAANANYV